MPKLPFPFVRVWMTFLAAAAFAGLLLLTGMWQLAYLAGFLAGMLSVRMRHATLLGALSVLVAWAAYLVYVFLAGQGAELANLVGAILGVGGGAWWLLTALTFVLGTLLGAVGGLTGNAAAWLFLWQPPAAAANIPKG